MPRQTALPMMLPPRLVSREAAAAYVCVSPNKFDEMVKDGQMPRPRLLGGKRRAWDVRALDAAVDQLPIDCDDSQGDNTWEDVDAA
jgi:predicted DNA-binding transcriptional regulator AlpA